ncbi:F-box domain-containing protein [Orpheovirus IHUMI-LCC2]|uniref:F-box domain-containing protein n=1 Tax=Orpheovirus IHUMI-LCC2 TaxID=2023057 RepID=A0A2I2L4H9_9VIRU|nr:F-box domain-containing protein [Orpheovirus IHUMI-LCC2]SNW62369.1 F-box domain-containing protein [Orpheovirus IHUMI-LCC2]
MDNNVEYLSLLDQTPSDVLINHIFINLPLYDIDNVCQYSERLSNICNNEETWKTLSRLKYYNKLNNKSEDDSWKDFYIKNSIIIIPLTWNGDRQGMIYVDNSNGWHFGYTTNAITSLIENNTNFVSVLLSDNDYSQPKILAIYGSQDGQYFGYLSKNVDKLKELILITDQNNINKLIDIIQRTNSLNNNDIYEIVKQEMTSINGTPPIYGKYNRTNNRVYILDVESHYTDISTLSNDINRRKRIMGRNVETFNREELLNLHSRLNPTLKIPNNIFIRDLHDVIIQDLININHMR